MISERVKKLKKLGLKNDEIFKFILDEDKRNKERSAWEFKKWGDEVKERDGICIVCGNEFELEAHHIIPLFINKFLSKDINNGITLCKYCHRLNENAVH